MGPRLKYLFETLKFWFYYRNGYQMMMWPNLQGLERRLTPMMRRLQYTETYKHPPWMYDLKAETIEWLNQNCGKGWRYTSVWGDAPRLYFAHQEHAVAYKLSVT